MLYYNIFSLYKQEFIKAFIKESTSIEYRIKKAKEKIEKSCEVRVTSYKMPVIKRLANSPIERLNCLLVNRISLRKRKK